MDIRAQQATYASVMRMTKWASLTLVVGLVFFVLWLCTGAGFGTALITAAVVAVQLVKQIYEIQSDYVSGRL